MTVACSEADPLGRTGRALSDDEGVSDLVKAQEIPDACRPPGVRRSVFGETSSSPSQVRSARTVSTGVSIAAGLVAVLATAGCSAPADAVPEEPLLTLPAVTTMPPGSDTTTGTPPDSAPLDQGGSALAAPAPGNPTLEAAWNTLAPEQQTTLCREFLISPDDTYALRVAPNPDLSSVTYFTWRAFLTRACQ